ncbi:hypothetical protein CA13_61890 [Planctomycetes bacterium CA13]|uniref:Uncharacterized protein n=1 Tax=Novipirellula herctigrandis TaxID=2527986 RepID=A0A5C5ZBD9_9BACT|nr:hypothetical protein CA13_61890 [Planctomycetes bacterium CA13]
MAAISESNAELSLAAEPAPRLSIRHLMLWTLCCAVYWALIREVNARSSSQMQVGLFSSIVTGAVFAGVITLISMRVRSSPPLLKHPGHWLLLISAIFTLIAAPVLHALTGSLALMNPFDPDRWEFVVIRILYLFPPIAFAFAAARIRDRIWKVLFIAMVLPGVPWFLSLLGIDLPSSYFHAWPKLVLASAMVVVSIVELKNGPRHDWLHWTGVTTHLASCSNLILRVLATLIP